MVNLFKKLGRIIDGLKGAAGKAPGGEASASAGSPEDSFAASGEAGREDTAGPGGFTEESVPSADGIQPEEPAAETGKEDLTGSPKKKLKKKKPWSLRKKIIVAAASVLGAAVLGVGVFLASMFIDPMGGFDTVGQQALRSPEPPVSLQPGDVNSAAPTPTLDALGELMAKSDFTILDQTVNILLIGVDYSEDRDSEDWIKHGGKQAFHSDVMIILAINKQTGSINLISLPRDTYADIPGVKGIYKLNASMDCGGGWKENPEAGCAKVCEAASWMIGNIPVDYYYAVDMNAVKQLVDSIGGLDFNIDVDYTMQGRSYKAGMQYMNGQAVLDYLRARKNMEDSGDLNRINRQKNMLVAILQKLKSSGLLVKIPDILAAFTGNLHTNLDLARTGALAVYAASVDTSKINLYSMDGSMVSKLFNWNFVVTDQKKRVQIIKDVYGFDLTNETDVAALEAKYNIKVPSYSHYSLKYALGLWEKMQIEVTTEKAKPLLDQVKSILDADAALPPYPEPVVPTDPAQTPPPPVPSDGYRKYPAGGDIWALYNKAADEYSRIDNWNTSGETRASYSDFQALITQLQADVQSICGTFGIGRSWKDFWHVNYGDTPKKTSANQHYMKNEIPVDFD